MSLSGCTTDISYTVTESEFHKLLKSALDEAKEIKKELEYTENLFSYLATKNPPEDLHKLNKLKSQLFWIFQINNPSLRLATSRLYQQSVKKTGSSAADNANFYLFMKACAEVAVIASARLHNPFYLAIREMIKILIANISQAFFIDNAQIFIGHFSKNNINYTSFFNRVSQIEGSGRTMQIEILRTLSIQVKTIINHLDVSDGGFYLPEVRSELTPYLENALEAIGSWLKKLDTTKDLKENESYKNIYTSLKVSTTSLLEKKIKNLTLSEKEPKSPEKEVSMTAQPIADDSLIKLSR